MSKNSLFLTVFVFLGLVSLFRGFVDHAAAEDLPRDRLCAEAATLRDLLETSTFPRRAARWLVRSQGRFQQACDGLDSGSSLGEVARYVMKGIKSLSKVALSESAAYESLQRALATIRTHAREKARFAASRQCGNAQLTMKAEKALDRAMVQLAPHKQARHHLRAVKRARDAVVNCQNEIQTELFINFGDVANTPDENPLRVPYTANQVKRAVDTAKTAGFNTMRIYSDLSANAGDSATVSDCETYYTNGTFDFATYGDKSDGPDYPSLRFCAFAYEVRQKGMGVYLTLVDFFRILSTLQGAPGQDYLYSHIDLGQQNGQYGIPKDKLRGIFLGSELSVRFDWSCDYTTCSDSNPNQGQGGSCTSTDPNADASCKLIYDVNKSAIIVDTMRAALKSAGLDVPLLLDFSVDIVPKTPAPGVFHFLSYTAETFFNYAIDCESHAVKFSGPADSTFRSMNYNALCDAVNKTTHAGDPVFVSFYPFFEGMEYNPTPKKLDQAFNPLVTTFKDKKYGNDNKQLVPSNVVISVGETGWPHPPERPLEQAEGYLESVNNWMLSAESPPKALGIFELFDEPGKAAPVNRAFGLYTELGKSPITRNVPYTPPQ